MQTITNTQTQVITIKTPIVLTIAKLENYFEQLSEALDTESLAANLLGEKKVKVEAIIFDIIDFAEAIQALTNKSMSNKGGYSILIDFLRDDFDSAAARTIFELIPGFEVIENVGSYQIVKKYQFHNIADQDGNLISHDSWLHLEDAVAAAEQLTTEV